MKRAPFDVAIRSLALAAVIVALFGGALFAADITIEIPSVIEARAGSIHLGEYAEIYGDPHLADAASMALITPKDGAFTRDDVVEALGSTTVAGASVALRVADRVVVRPESRVAAELRAMTNWRWRIAVEGDENIDDYTDFTLPQRVVPGATSVSLKVDTGKPKMGTKHVKLEWYQPVVYSLVPLTRGEMPDMTKLAMRIDTIKMNDDYIWDITSLRSSAPRQPVAALKAISASDFTHVDMVRSGSSVTLVSNVNGLGIEVAGIALQRGGIGDVIKVKNLASKKILRGTVIAADRVMIE